MLCGVFSLHQRGYLHLDIKPDNFIVDSNGKIRLTDYGLSQKKKEIISFLKGCTPVLTAFVGLIAVFIGIADLKDKKEAKKEEAAEAASENK